MKESAINDLYHFAIRVSRRGLHTAYMGEKGNVCMSLKLQA